MRLDRLEGVPDDREDRKVPGLRRGRATPSATATHPGPNAWARWTRQVDNLPKGCTRDRESA